MKRFLFLIAFVAVLVPARAQAQADSTEASASSFSMGAGISLGLMDGMGIGLSFRVIDQLNVRVGYGMIPSFLVPEVGIDVPELGSYPATNTAVSGSFRSSGNLLVDYHPGGKSFHVTAGIFFGAKDLVKLFNTKALPDTYRNAGISYYVDGDKSDISNFYRIQPDEKGFVSGALRTGAVRPFVGIGFGSAVPRKRVGVAFDLGVEYDGGLELRTDARNIMGEVENIPLSTAGVKQTIRDMSGSSSGKSYDQYAGYVDRLRSLPILPVARIGVYVKLF
jgi:hypothetical protein